MGLTALLLALVFYLLACSSAIGSGEMPSATASREGEELRLTYSFPAPAVERTYGGEYALVRINGLKLESIPGKPVVPYRQAAVLIPAGKEVAGVRVEAGPKRLIGNFVLEPGAEIAPLGAGTREGKPVPDRAVYASAKPYPAEPISPHSVQYKSGCPILIANLYPVEYVPATGEVSYYEALTLVVQLRPARGGGNFTPSRIDMLMIEKMIDNPEELQGYLERRESARGQSSKLLPGACDYVIITSGALKAAFEPLAEWRNAQGLKSAVVTVEDICAAYVGRDPQEKIRNFIKEAKEKNGVSFVLLGGDADGGSGVVPARGLFVPEVEGGDCLVETAAKAQEDVKPQGLVETVRNFRDRFVRPSYVEMYYRHDPVLKAALLSDLSLLKEAAALLLKYEPRMRLLVAGEEDGYVLSEADAQELAGFVSRLRERVRARGDAECAEVLSELERMEAYLAGAAGKTFGEAVKGSPYAGPGAAGRAGSNLQEEPKAIIGDIYYACLDGSYDGDGDGVFGEPHDGEDGGEVDLLAEVYVGRAPVDSPEEAAAFVRKTIAYEATAASSERLKAAWMVGEKLDEQTYGSSYKDEIKNGKIDGQRTTAGFPPSFTVQTLYDLPDYEWPKEEAISVLNGSPHLLNHIGHGNVDYVMKMYNEDVEKLVNEEPFFLYTQSCYSGSFDNCDPHNVYLEKDCIAEQMVAGPAGAFAVVANSRYGWYTKNSTEGPSHQFDREFWDAVFGEGLLWLGVANQDSKEDNASEVLTQNVMRFCYYEINLLGDPATRIILPGAEEEALRILETFPADGAADVPLDAAITVTFNREIQPGDEFEGIELKAGAGKSAGVEKSTGGRVLTVRPLDRLAPAMRYTLAIPAGAVKDVSGNALQVGYAFSFTTAGGVADNDPPRMIGSDPAPNAKDVPVNKTITVTFSESVQPGSKFDQILLKDAAGNLVSFIPSFSGNALAIDPVEDLKPGARYTLTVPAGAVKDLAGNELREGYLLSFSTGPANIKTLAVVGTEPPEGGEVASKKPKLRVYFNKTVKAGRNYSKIALYDPDGRKVSAKKKVAGSYLEVQPLRALKPGLTYRLYLPPGAVKGAAGNQLAEEFWLEFEVSPSAR